MLHHQINPPEKALPTSTWISLAGDTWKENDGKQKIHYSQKNSSGKKGAHSMHIRSSQFLDFYKHNITKDIDIMLEVKDKNLSVIKCNLLTNKSIHVKQLEQEWARYKYFVLSRSATIYNSIRGLLKDKLNPNTLGFYLLLDEALEHKMNIGSEINAAQHVWGYISKKANPIEVKRYQKLLDGYENNESKVQLVKRHLYGCVKRQGLSYLLQSLYFYILD